MMECYSVVPSSELLMILRGFIPTIPIVVIGIMIGHWDTFRHQQTLIKLNNYIFLPCLTFSALHRHTFELQELLSIGSAVAFMILILTIGTRLLLRDETDRDWISRSAAIYMSSGTLLLPLSYILFGNQGLAKALYFHFFVLLLYHTLGRFLADGRSDLRGVFKVPSFYVGILGVAVAIFPVSVPENLQEFAWLSEKGIDIIAMGALPLLLINFGYPLGLLRISDLRKGMNGGFLRILSGPVLAFFLVYVYRKIGWLGMEKGYDILAYIDRRTTEAILVLGASMPSSHYALRFDHRNSLRAGDGGAAVLLVSVIGGIFTVAAVLILIDMYIFH